MNLKEYFKKYTKQSKKGFTMVELIAVIVIMAIISTATVSVFLSVQTTVRDTSKLTTQQHTATQMEKFIRYELQTASKIDVHGFDEGEPMDYDMKLNDEYMFFNGQTRQLIFTYCDELDNIKNKMVIDKVEDVKIDICPVNYSATDVTNMPFKVIYKIKTDNYTYSGGIVIGNSYVDDASTFKSANLIADDPDSGLPNFQHNKVSLHWYVDTSVTDFTSEDYWLPADSDNLYCITFHTVGTQKNIAP